ncbi:MAG: RluA family pseudouridine synthase [Ruminococcaceae bacterium]|nr:RluA family pseudouridine synthase [Oscillospiraceae bacterium]
MKSVEILFFDEDVAVAVKPAGVLSQSDEKGRESMLSLLKAELGGEIYPVHRLDRETAGVMVFARSSAAAAALSSALQEKKFVKEYLAVLTALPAEEEGILEDLLFFDRGKNKVYPVKRSRRGVKDARLRYALREKQNGLALVRVFPETGRTHQIRVQFASRKMPLFGDRKYGGSGNGLALFCRSLSFPHPKNGKLLSFSATPEKSEPWSSFQSL